MYFIIHLCFENFCSQKKSQFKGNGFLMKKIPLLIENFKFEILLQISQL